MFSINPFAELSSTVSPAIMQTYVIIMIALVVGGTLFDIVHKKSAKYFFSNWRKAGEKGSREVGGGEIVGIAVKTAVVEVATSGEFCNMKRRIAHLLTMYGFIDCIAEANGSRSNLPEPADEPEQFGSARRRPSHY